MNHYTWDANTQVVVPSLTGEAVRMLSVTGQEVPYPNPVYDYQYTSGYQVHSVYDNPPVRIKKIHNAQKVNTKLRQLLGVDMHEFIN